MEKGLLQIAAPIFFERYGWDPSQLINKDWLSDYFSGPEDSAETKEAWKICMAENSGINHEKMDQKQWDATLFWERSRPAWRSMKVRAR